MSIEMIGLIVSAASFVVTVVFWLIDSFVFEKKLRKKKKATIYRVTLKKNPKNIDIYDEDYLGKIYLKHDGKIRRLGNNDIRYLEDKRRVEMTNASDYAYSKENSYTTNNIRNPHDPHDARVPDEEEKEITVSANDYIFVGESEHQNSAAFYIKRAKAYTFRQLLTIALISIFASSAVSFYVVGIQKKPLPPSSMVRCIEYYKDFEETEKENLDSYKSKSVEYFEKITNNPFATDNFRNSNYNTIGSHMWYVYGRLLLEGHTNIPTSFKEKYVSEWIKNFKEVKLGTEEEISHANEEIKNKISSYIVVWKDPNVDYEKIPRLRVAYVEKFQDDGEELVSESGLTVKKDDEIARLMPGVSYVVIARGDVIDDTITKAVTLHNDDYTPTQEINNQFSILHVLSGPKARMENINEPEVKDLKIIPRKEEKYFWYQVKDTNDIGWVRLDDFHRTGINFNTEFNLQGIDLCPHPLSRYWTLEIDDMQPLNGVAKKVYRITK